MQTHRLTGIRTLVLFVALAAGECAVRADHFSGASITYECLSGNQYRVNLDLYLDCAGAAITPHNLYFSNNCGVVFTIANLTPISNTEVSPLCPSQLTNSTCNGGTQPSFRKYRFQTTLFLSPCNKWTIEWYTCCRNTTVNVSGQPGMYVVATLNNAGGLCDDSPVFVDSGIPYVCVNQPVAYNPGVNDPDGNTMSFGLVSARYAAPAPTNVTYQGGFTGTTPIPGIFLNPTSGQIYFTPTVTGYYVVVYEVSTYTSGGVLIGKVMRDLMFAVIACDGVPPQTAGLTQGTNGVTYGPSQFIACTGSSFCVSMSFSDPAPSTVITVQSNATSVLPGASFNVSGTNPAVATVCWTGNSSILPLTIWFQASDNACPIANTTSTFAQAISCVYLPIELLSFEAQDHGAIVHTEWVTGSETNNAFFVVERSADGDLFQPVGTVPGSGTTPVAHSYSFDDPAPLDGTSYYRLRQSDEDGMSATSEVVAVQREEADRMTATTMDHLQWLVQGADPGAAWTLLDAHGSITAHGRIHDDSSETITVPNGDGGLHVLIVHSEKGAQVMKLPPGDAGDATQVSAAVR